MTLGPVGTVTQAVSTAPPTTEAKMVLAFINALLLSRRGRIRQNLEPGPAAVLHIRVVTLVRTVVPVVVALTLEAARRTLFDVGHRWADVRGRAVGVRVARRIRAIVRITPVVRIERGA